MLSFCFVELLLLLVSSLSSVLPFGRAAGAVFGLGLGAGAGPGWALGKELVSLLLMVRSCFCCYGRSCCSSPVLVFTMVCCDMTFSLLLFLKVRLSRHAGLSFANFQDGGGVCTSMHAYT